MSELAAAYRVLMLAACVAGLAMILAFAVFAGLGTLCARLRIAFSNSNVSLALSTLAVLGIAHYGATKGIVTRDVIFPRTDPAVAYLEDDGSYVTNNMVHVAFKSYLIPGDAIIVLDYWPVDSTNEADVVTAVSGPLSMFPNPMDYAFENAISNRWYCYTTWTPGPAVHTNGVWQAIWMTDRRENRYLIPIRTRVEVDGEAVAPPSAGTSGQDQGGDGDEQD